MFSLQEGIRRTIDSYKHLRADAPAGRRGPSKAELLLGNGKGADLFPLPNSIDKPAFSGIMSAIFQSGPYFILTSFRSSYCIMLNKQEA